MTHTPSGVAWTALIVAILALILGWAAFNRAGVDLEEIVKQEVQEAVQEVEEEYQEAERAFRDEASDVLIDAGTDVSVDGDPNNVGE